MYLLSYTRVEGGSGYVSDNTLHKHTPGRENVVHLIKS